MRVKFTNTLNSKEILFGSVIEMFNAEMLVVQSDKGGRYIVNPNSDYNFGFIWNEEAERKFAERLNAYADEMEYKK